MAFHSCDHEVHYFLPLDSTNVSGAGSPQRPSRPTLLKVTDTTVTFSWQENECNGGHFVESFSIRYGLPTIFFFRSYSYIQGIDGDQRNYTITGLTPSTTYEVSVQAVSTDSATSSYSLSTTFTTLTEGMPLIMHNYDCYNRMIAQYACIY